MAPEISRRLKKEKSDLESVDQGPDNPIFNKYTDLYSMAYHVFALLMNGCSPYASMANMEELSQHRVYIIDVLKAMPASIKFLYFPLVFPGIQIKNYIAQKKGNAFDIVNDDIEIIRKEEESRNEKNK